MIKVSDLVIVSNEYLKNYAVRYNKNVCVITTPVYLHNTKRMRKNDIFTIGWIGNWKVHEKNLSLLISPLKKLTKRHKIRFILLGAVESKKIPQMFKMKNLKLIIPKKFYLSSKLWLDENEIAKYISTFDVGVMPLIYNEESLGKCSFKCKQYMSVGIPCIASPVGDVIGLINDGCNGFLASNDDEWIKKLELLMKNKKLRKHISKNAIKTIKENNSYDVVSKKLVKCLRSLTAK